MTEIQLRRWIVVVDREADVSLGLEDRQLQLRLSPSSFGVNAGMYSGQIVGVEKSQVRLFASEGRISGVIEWPGHRVRLIESPDSSSTVTAVEEAYYNLIFSQENIKVQQKAVELAEQTLAENKKRVEVGAMASPATM